MESEASCLIRPTGLGLADGSAAAYAAGAPGDGDLLGLRSQHPPALLRLNRQHDWYLDRKGCQPAGEVDGNSPCSECTGLRLVCGSMAYASHNKLAGTVTRRMIPWNGCLAWF
jgi:hypothetical protein